MATNLGILSIRVVLMRRIDWDLELTVIKRPKKIGRVEGIDDC